MSKVDLSIIIPSRHEMFLNHTIQDILAHMKGNTEIIVGCDSEWPVEPIPDHERVHIIHHSISIGQRAIVNEGVRLSRAKYICKVDAHCSFDEGFDVKLMADMQDNWTMVPLMKNLHAFDWVCKKCGDRWYQGPTPTSCPKCGNTTEFERDVVWISKNNPQSTSYCFDPEPHFQYFREFKDRPEGRGDITEMMSLQGSCFVVTRDKFIELDLCDEKFGSWGSQGIEVAVKTWLSGGRVVCNHKTWYGHLFRTQGGDFGFPYDLSGKQVSRAKHHAHDLFFNNKWPKQIHPLSWLIDKFWPVPGWSESDRKMVMETGIAFMLSQKNSISMGDMKFPVPNVPTDFADTDTVNWRGKQMSIGTPDFSKIFSRGVVSPQNVFSMRDQSQMSGIATGRIIADMINFSVDSDRNRTNQPSINQTVNVVEPVIQANIPISIPSDRTLPNPTLSHRIKGVDFDFEKDSINDLSGEGADGQILNHNINISENKIPSKGIIYYTDNRLDETIFSLCQKILLKVCNGNEITSVSLRPIDFGRNTVLPLERGYLTMTKQQLAALENSTSDIIFFCEHDCLYPACHFDFTPPKKDVFYYDLSWVKVRTNDGQALSFRAKQVSGLCAYRDILIEYFSNRVKLIENGEIGGRRHFEPGGGRYRRASDAGYNKLTDKGFDTWFSEVPYVDIRHNKVVTRNIFDPSGYNHQVVDWKLQDGVPFWGKTKGRFSDFIKDIREAVK